MAVPRLDKIVLNMGMGEAVANAKVLGYRGGRIEIDRRAETGDHSGQEIDRQLQAATGDADRCDGSAARRADVRVL